jgi:DNA-binding transcriptional LysR family regulator
MPRIGQRRYFKEMRLQQLRGLCEVARQGSFAAAALTLKISRPAIWQQVRALESEFGASLVERRGRRAELTADGRLLLEIVAPLITGFDGIKTAFRDRREEIVRHLVVTTTASLLAHELKEPVREYLRRFPHVQLTLMDRPSPGGMSLLEDRTADLAVVGHLEEEPRHPLMDYQPLFAYPFVFACRKDHELARRRTIRLADIVRYPLVLTAEGSRSRSRVDRVLREHGLLQKRRIALDTTNGALLTQYVELGLGITVVPLSTQHPSYRRLHVRPVRQWFGEEPVMLVRRKGEPDLSHVAAFREILVAALAQPGSGN